MKILSEFKVSKAFIIDLEIITISLLPKQERELKIVVSFNNNPT